MQDWAKDSEMIFKQITNGDFPTFEMANDAVCQLYVVDKSVSRGGIAHALGRLEQHYKNTLTLASPPPVPTPPPAKGNSMFKIEKDVPYTNGRMGPKLGRFPLAEMELGESFLIPFAKRTVKGKIIESPMAGINVKAASEKFAPKVFKKSREPGGVRIHRVE